MANPIHGDKFKPAQLLEMFPTLKQERLMEMIRLNQIRPCGPGPDDFGPETVRILEAYGLRRVNP